MPIPCKVSEKTRGALGLCAKARRLISGTPMICEAMREARAKPLLVLTAADNSPNTQKRLTDRCAFYGVELILLDCDGSRLSDLIGKSGRVAAVAITDENFCRLIRTTLTEN